MSNKRNFPVSILKEEEYKLKMAETVEPYLALCEKEGALSVKGGNLHYYLYPKEEAVGTVLICHGFSESAEKLKEFTYYLLQEGYQVIVWDERGHGKSLREGKDDNVVYVNRFEDYVEDMHLLMEKITKPFSKGTDIYLFAHSMGGCVGAYYLEQYPGDIKKAVLNAPMIGLQLGNYPLFLAKVLCDFMILIGKGKDRLFVHGEFNPDEPFSESCSGSLARHEYYLAIRRENPCYQTSSASYSWGSNAIRAGRIVMKNAFKIQIPVLLFQAGKDNQVSSKAQDKFMKKVKMGKLRKVPDAKHEIYREKAEILDPYLEEIFHFLQEG